MNSTRLHTDLTWERSRHWQPLEKLREDAADQDLGRRQRRTPCATWSKALIANERDPIALAGLARGRMRAKHAPLIEALTGRFDDYNAELARMLLDQADCLTAQSALTSRIEDLVAAIPAAWGVDADGNTAPARAARPMQLEQMPSPSSTKSLASAQPEPRSSWT